MAASPPIPTHGSVSYDLELTVVSAKHLKNVNWRSGDLKPYAVAYLHPDRRSATKPDDSGSTSPVWNERLSLPLPFPLFDPRLLLTLDVFHSKPSETPKPLVGSARIPLNDLIDSENFLSVDGSNRIKTIELKRPSGRPHGKIKIKVWLRERPAPPDPSFQFPPPPSNYPYHYSAPRYSPPSPPQPQHIMPPSYPPSQPSQFPYSGYSNIPYSNSANYYSTPPNPSYYSAPPSSIPTPRPPPVREYYDRPAGAYGGPSAPAGYNTTPGNNPSYDQRNKSGRFEGVGSGTTVGAVTGVLGAMTLEQRIKYEEDKIAEKAEVDVSVRDNYSEYRAGH